MSDLMRRWAPGSILSAGVLITMGLGPQRVMDVREPLAVAVPSTYLGLTGRDLEVSEEESQVAGFDEYLLRSYAAPSEAGFSVYVGYYGSQTRGHTIHSPKNCLPGSGWEALSSQPQQVVAADGRAVTVNRYLLRRKDEQALVLYWYQGRGRVANNEYLVKWNLLRDAAMRQRSDEALVRIVVPITGSEQEAGARAVEIAQDLIPAVERALPL
jgi:EpsI family protein